jgi:hypothetical protein
MSAKKPGFYGKFIILTNGLYEETGFLGSECVNPVNNKAQNSVFKNQDSGLIN